MLLIRAALQTRQWIAEQPGTRSVPVTDTDNKGAEESVFHAALRLTAHWLPSVAMVVTIIVYWVSTEVLRENRPVVLFGASARDLSGEFAVLCGIVAGFLTWLALAYLRRPSTAAACVSPRNYNGLKERLDSLKIRVKLGEEFRSQEVSENSVLETMRRQALDRAKEERDVIEKKLASKGMPWVTGLGYIELWHRVHRAEEALINVETSSEAIAGAVRDSSRLSNANMEYKERLLQLLTEAVAILDNSGTSKSLSLLVQPPQDSVAEDDEAKEALSELLRNAVAKLTNSETENEGDRVTPEKRAKALIMMSIVRYEINYFRDNAWEGLVHARTRLADTSVVLGLFAYGLLALALFVGASPSTISWVVAYFLIGALAGLFARAQTESTAETAVDDFGLSKTRLLQIPWLSGLAAVGGVWITSILDPPSSAVGSAGGSYLTAVFSSSEPLLIIVAAIFGLTPSLLIRRLDQQADKYKENLQSTQTSQSTEDNQSSQNGERRSDSRR